MFSGFARFASKAAKGAGKKANGKAVISEYVVPKARNWSKWLIGIGAGAVAAGSVVFASEDSLQPPYLPWNHLGYFEGYDHASMRRGFEVYRQVCSTCHSLNLIAYRNLVGETHTEVQAKALAQSVQVQDGPNDKGDMFERPGKLSDKMPSPYPNEEFARMANGGALPPDLSLMGKSRARGEDYIFHLLTGYKDAPHGIQLRQGLYYNPYFPGGAIAMPKPLSDGQVEYEDGTPATESQMAKDVSVFLAWAAEPKLEERKQMAAKFLLVVGLMALGAAHHKRFVWNVWKNRKIEYRERP